MLTKVNILFHQEQTWGWIFAVEMGFWQNVLFVCLRIFTKLYNNSVLEWGFFQWYQMNERSFQLKSSHWTSPGIGMDLLNCNQEWKFWMDQWNHHQEWKFGMDIWIRWNYQWVQVLLCVSVNLYNFSQKHGLYCNHKNHNNQLTGDGCPRAFDVPQYLSNLEMLLISWSFMIFVTVLWLWQWWQKQVLIRGA